MNPPTRSCRLVFAILLVLGGLGMSEVEVVAGNTEESVDVAVRIGIVGKTTCVLTSRGTVTCWGRHQADFSYLDGLGTPQTIGGFSERVVSFAMFGAGVGSFGGSGASAGCGLMTDRSVRCWGVVGDYGQSVQTTQAIDVGVRIEEGELTSASPTSVCWRTNEFLERCRPFQGVTSVQSRDIPMPPEVPTQTLSWSNFNPNPLFGTKVVNSIPCTATPNFQLICYQNSKGNGDLPLGWNIVSEGVRQVDGNCYVSITDTVFCSGYDHQTRTSIPHTVIPSGVDFISGNCAALKAGGLACWSYKQFKYEVNNLLLFPATRFAAIHGSCAETLSKELRCWGALDVEDPGITGVRQVASGTVHRCVITNIGGVKCWGDNSEGQLGIGSDELTEEVVDVVGFVQEKRAPTTSTTQVSTTTTVSPSSTTSLPIRKPRLIEDPRWRPERTTGVSIEVNGRKVSVVLKVESGKLRVKAAEVNLEIRGSDVEELNLDPESMDPIGVDPPEEFMIDVDGLEPGSEIAAVVYSEPVMLGQEVVGADGAAHLSVRIPSTLESGSHTLVLEGVSAEGESVMAQLGIRVNSSQGTVDWRWLALLVILFGIVVALALPAVKTRRVRPGT